MVNDPVWSTLELLDHEIILVDSPLIQRLRGVRQLGLAHLVFPGANHDRFEHVCGVVESAERMFTALERNIRARTGRPGAIALPEFTENERKLVRLAALLHDTGHGPFSHAVEPVVERRYADAIRSLSNAINQTVYLDAKLAGAEAISALITISEPMAEVLGQSKFSVGIDDLNEYQFRLAILILGARSYNHPACFSAIISSQIDSDKLDYLARDAHHTGMPITFDTERLIRKLEVVQCTESSLPLRSVQQENVEFARNSPNKSYSDIAIVESGVGALEQMLIGRAFLYDRLYHHHKVRAADAMAQRLIHFAELHRKRPFDLHELYLNIGDDSLIRVLGGELRHKELEAGGEFAEMLAKAILERQLYHRAFVFRANFHAGIDPQLDETQRSRELAERWTHISTELSGLKDRLDLEQAIFERAKHISTAVSDPVIRDVGPELLRPHVIVDLSDNRVKPITINVHAEDGMLEEPNLFFDPSRWSHVYDLQKRTGYVFTPRKFVPLIGLASAMVFFERWGYAGAKRARRFLKSGIALREEWLDELVRSGDIDRVARDVLFERKSVRLFLRPNEIRLPNDWSHEDGELTTRVADMLRLHLPQGFSHEDLEAVRAGIDELSSFIDMAMKDASFTKLKGMTEADLQEHLRRHIRSRNNTPVTEGAELGGGETDLLLGGRCLIENKIDKTGKGPFTVKPEAPFQAHRYALALCSRLFFTLVGYQPKNEAAIVPQTQSLQVRALEGLAHTAVEIRFVVPFGLSNPSDARTALQNMVGSTPAGQAAS